MPGDYMAMASTKSGSTVKALNVIKEEIHKIGESEVTDAEIQQAKDSILNGIAFDFDSTGKIVTGCCNTNTSAIRPTSCSATKTTCAR